MPGIAPPDAVRGHPGRVAGPDVTVCTLVGTPDEHDDTPDLLAAATLDAARLHRELGGAMRAHLTSPRGTFRYVHEWFAHLEPSWTAVTAAVPPTPVDHALRSARWLCPAPTADGRCFTPLPCTEHNIEDAATGIRSCNACTANSVSISKPAACAGNDFT